MIELSRAIRGGGLSVVLQRPSDAFAAVTPAKYTSLLELEPLFHFVEPADLIAQARNCSFDLLSQRTEALKSRKAFEVLYFQEGRRSMNRVVALLWASACQGTSEQVVILSRRSATKDLRMRKRLPFPDPSPSSRLRMT
ncbi:MAG TPA: hypothetical protein VLV78_08480 [Thermoanaerobaculia bacterium]|nr:hypothetical protein [Thermoanaerobaculia bacterium]